MAVKIGRSHLVDTPAFVGRDDALGEVVAALEHGPSMVLVEGEPGIGKTRLLHEVLQAEELADRRVLQARCPPLRDPFPLGAVADGLRWLVAATDVTVADLDLSRLGGALRTVFPEWSDDLPPSLEPLDDQQETRHRLLRAVTELVQRLQVDVLVVEDAHWADPVTLEWLVSIGTQPDLAMSRLITVRPMDVPEGSLLPTVTSRVPPGTARVQVGLEPLDVAQTGQFASSMLDNEEISEEFATFLHAHTDGIPLALEETICGLRDRHDLIRPEGRWVRRALDEIEVPATVRDSVLQRVARLPDQVRVVLEAAAVLAAPADRDMIATVAGLDDHDGQLGLDAALTSKLLREARRNQYEFRHSLDADAVLETVPASRLRTLHSLAGRAVGEAMPKAVVRLARHAREAGDIQAWCRHAEASAELAVTSGDDRTAVVTLLDVLTSAEHPIDRHLRLARILGDAWFFSGEDLSEFLDDVLAVLRTVLAADDLPSEDRGELRLLLGRALWGSHREVQALRENEAAIADLTHRPDLAIRAMANLAFPFLPDWPAGRHLKWLDRASELADVTGDPSDRTVVRATRRTTLLLLGEEAGWKPLEASLRPDSSRSESRSVAARSINIAQATLMWGRHAASVRRLDEASHLMEAAGFQIGLNQLMLARARLAWWTGQWEGLAAVTANLFEVPDDGGLVRLGARLLAGLLDLAGGNRRSAESHLQHVCDEASRYEAVYPSLLGAHAALARLHLADGAPERALDLTADSMTTIAGKPAWLWATDVAPVHVDALLAVDSQADAGEVVAAFTGWLEGRDVPAAAAVRDLCEAAVVCAQGRPDDAADLYAAAADAFAAMPRAHAALLARERHGLCLLEAGRGDEALEALADAERRLGELGANWDADRVAGVLRGHGVTVARAWRQGRTGYGDDLSPRELEVVSQVAEGKTNKQIAEVLYISHRTVGKHLSNAMRKLDCSSRTAVVVAAYETGLLDADDAV